MDAWLRLVVLVPVVALLLRDRPEKVGPRLDGHAPFLELEAGHRISGAAIWRAFAASVLPLAWAGRRQA